MRLVAILRWPALLAGLIVLYLYLIFVLCPRVAAAEPTNGLANPGFENGLESWTEPFFGSPFGLSSTTFHGGILAAAQTVPLGGNASQDYWSEIYDAATTTVKEAPPSALVGTLDEPAPLAGMPGSDEFVEEE